MAESKLTYRLSKLEPEERDELIGRLQMSPSTYYQRRNRPGEFTLDELTVVKEFLEEREGEHLDIFRLARETVQA